MLTKKDLEIDTTLTAENASERNMRFEQDVLIDPKHPEWGLEELMDLKTQGHFLGQPSDQEGDRVGVYEQLPTAESGHFDLLDEETDTSNDTIE